MSTAVMQHQGRPGRRGPAHALDGVINPIRALRHGRLDAKVCSERGRCERSMDGSAAPGTGPAGSRGALRNLARPGPFRPPNPSCPAVRQRDPDGLRLRARLRGGARHEDPAPLDRERLLAPDRDGGEPAPTRLSLRGCGGRVQNCGPPLLAVAPQAAAAGGDSDHAHPGGRAHRRSPRGGHPARLGAAGPAVGRIRRHQHADRGSDPASHHLPHDLAAGGRRGGRLNRAHRSAHASNHPGPRHLHHGCGYAATADMGRSGPPHDCSAGQRRRFSTGWG